MICVFLTSETHQTWCPLVKASATLSSRSRRTAALSGFFVLFASRGRFGTLWRNREADKHFEQSLENLKDVITGQTSILAFGPLTGGL